MSRICRNVSHHHPKDLTVSLLAKAILACLKTFVSGMASLMPGSFCLWIQRIPAPVKQDFSLSTAQGRILEDGWSIPMTRYSQLKFLPGELSA